MVDTIISNSGTTLIDGAVDRTHLRSDVYVGVSRLKVGVGGNCFTLQACLIALAWLRSFSNYQISNSGPTLLYTVNVMPPTG